MNTTATVLLVLLAVGYLLLLILAIVMVAILISIFRTIKRITRRAEQTTESFSDIVAMVGKRVAPVALSAAVAAAMRRFKSKKE